jgi:hypothetical protein
VLVLTSQPSIGLLLQSAKPWLQVTPHLPTEHIGTLLGPNGQAKAVPQPPQLLTSVLMLTSQPSLGLLLQSRKPGLQLAITQLRAEHIGTALESEQTLPQPPQLLTSLLMSTKSSLPALVVWPLETVTVVFLAMPLCSATSG